MHRTESTWWVGGKRAIINSFTAVVFSMFAIQFYTCSNVTTASISHNPDMTSLWHAVLWGVMLSHVISSLSHSYDIISHIYLVQQFSSEEHSY